MARPKKKIDYEQVERLAHIHCTQEEIASALGLSVDTLQRDPEFCGIYKKGVEAGKRSLRRLQWEAAEGKEGEVFYDKNRKVLVDDRGRPLFRVLPQAPNVTMQIWLGKQLLGQKDLVEHDVGDNLRTLIGELRDNRDKA